MRKIERVFEIPVSALKIIKKVETELPVKGLKIIKKHKQES